jgi:ectonucleotide pyrophosphatase/phosphodiesterase family protein 5
MPQPDRARVILFSVDALVLDAIDEELTPHIVALAASGGRARDGQIVPLPSSTYPSHASLFTGLMPERHGMRANSAFGHADPANRAWYGGRRVVAPTLLSRARAAGLNSAVALGDFRIYDVVGGEDATRAFPPAGRPSADDPLDLFGYLTNAAVQPAVLASAGDADLDLLVAHYNEPDTWGHLFTPAAGRTRQSYAEVDAMIGAAIDAARADWDRLLVIVTSDHGMEPLADARFVPLLELPGVADLVADALEDGGSALVLPREGVTTEEVAAAFLAAEDIAAATVTSLGDVIVEAVPGVRFGSDSPNKVMQGGHGGPTTARGIAIVGGGHPAAARIGARIAEQTPRQIDWAPTIAAVLGLPPVPSDGVDLGA